VSAAAGEGEVCRFLRARSAYGHPLDGASWEEGESTIESYWCLCTMEPTGPDDRLVTAHDCRAGRSCFAPRTSG
jgi:hypothetical protein